MEDTVKLDIAIDIRISDVVDTGMSVQSWNALTNEQRYEKARAIWEAMAESDNGGISVLTEGAEGV